MNIRVVLNVGTNEINSPGLPLFLLTFKKELLLSTGLPYFRQIYFISVLSSIVFLSLCLFQNFSKVSVPISCEHVFLKQNTQVFKSWKLFQF